MAVVHLATCREMPEPDGDESLLVEALRRRGQQVRVQAWDDDAASWGSSLCVIRSTWNYHLRCQEFLAWCERVAGETRLANPPRVVRWNAHKTYLRALDEQGVGVTETAWLTRGDRVDLRAIVAERGWEAVVVKPTISAGSFATVRGHRDDLSSAEQHLREQLPQRDMMVQRYVASVEGYGERALVWIDGAITHAVRKSPRFAGQSEQVSESMAVAEDEARFATEVLSHVPVDELLYSRVDVARDDRGGLLVMEVELIEPSLFLRESPSALDRFADAIVRRAQG
jgi:glutathione synthase/RimK-type ligase-like ATP-grasp enzyme